MAGNDHPNLRSFPICCLCQQPKEAALLVCWPCYRLHGLRYGNPEIEARLDAAEKVQ